MFKSAARCGLKIHEFWQITPYELMLYTEAFIETKQAQSNEMIAQAYMIASLTRAKRMPRLETLLIKVDKKEKTDEDLLNAVIGLNAEFGGEVIGSN